MSNITVLSLVLGVPLAAAIAVVVILLVKVRRLGRQVADFPEREKEIRSDARKRSRTVHMASISEQLAPLLPGFRYNPKDVQWVGGHGAIDAIVWNGLEAGGDVEIVFLDVKTGPHAHLTGNQRRIREAIAWKRIAFDVYSPPETPLLIEALSTSCRTTRPCPCPRTRRMMSRTSNPTPGRQHWRHRRCPGAVHGRADRERRIRFVNPRPRYCRCLLIRTAFAVAARPCRAGVPTQSPAEGAPAAPQRGAALI